LKDPDIVNEIAAVEQDRNLPDRETRKRTREIILKKYIAPE
jgi:hypothetical protein